MDKIEKIPIPEDVKRVLDDVSHILIGLNYRETARDYKQAVEKLISLSEEPELVRHPPIAYTYPSDASRDEQLKRALLALLNSDLIKVAGNKFTKQDLIDWVEKQKEEK